jgi:hypothetical protein
MSPRSYHGCGDERQLCRAENTDGRSQEDQRCAQDTHSDTHGRHCLDQLGTIDRGQHHHRGGQNCHSSSDLEENIGLQSRLHGRELTSDGAQALPDAVEHASCANIDIHTPAEELAQHQNDAAQQSGVDRVESRTERVGRDRVLKSRAQIAEALCDGGSHVADDPADSSENGLSDLADVGHLAKSVAEAVDLPDSVLSTTEA